MSRQPPPDPSSVLEPGKPCLKCGVRADVSCKHRGAEERKPLPPPEEFNTGRPRSYVGMGYNFGVAKRGRPKGASGPYSRRD